MTSFVLPYGTESENITERKGSSMKKGVLESTRGSCVNESRTTDQALREMARKRTKLVADGTFLRKITQVTRARRTSSSKPEGIPGEELGIQYLLTGRQSENCRVITLTGSAPPILRNYRGCEPVNLVLTTEQWISYEERQSRLEAYGDRRAGLETLLYLWRNQNKIPKDWKRKIDESPRNIFFDRHLVISPSLGRFILGLCWDTNQNEWRIHSKTADSLSMFYHPDCSLIV